MAAVNIQVDSIFSNCRCAPWSLVLARRDDTKRYIVDCKGAATRDINLYTHSACSDFLSLGEYEYVLVKRGCGRQIISGVGEMDSSDMIDYKASHDSICSWICRIANYPMAGLLTSSIYDA